MRTRSRRFYSLRFAFLLLGISLATGILFYTLVEDYSFVDSFYMTVITISTVGYGTIGELSDAGKIFTSLYIIFNISIFAYIVSVLTKYLFEGKLKDIVNKYMINASVRKLKDHVIVCGLGRNGARACEELRSSNMDYVVIDINPEIFQSKPGEKPHTHYIVGDATVDDTLKLAGIERAKAIITAMPHDSDNVFVTLTAREMNKTIYVIARAVDPSSERKLYRAGADQVVMPDIIGGHYMASLVTKPTVIEFLEMINGVRGEVKLKVEEFDQEEFKEEYQSVAIKDLDIRRLCGVTILGYKHPDKGIVFNPGSHEIFQPGAEVIVLGTDDDMSKFKEIYIA